MDEQADIAFKNDVKFSLVNISMYTISICLDVTEEKRKIRRKERRLRKRLRRLRTMKLIK